MTNEQMKPNRFLDMMKYKKLYTAIVAEIEKGLAIQITTYTKSSIYKSASQFKYGKSGVYVQRGKNWDCINYANIRSVKI